MSYGTDRARRIQRIGITEDDLSALESIWNTETFRLIADQRTGFLADKGYIPLDGLDAIWHELEGASAHLYMQHGVSPHQAFLLDTNKRAQENLWGTDADSDRLHRLLATPITSELLVTIVLVAKSPEEAEALLASFDGKAPNPDGLDPFEATTQLGARARLLGVQVEDCDCDDQPRPGLRLV